MSQRPVCYAWLGMTSIMTHSLTTLYLVAHHWQAAVFDGAASDKRLIKKLRSEGRERVQIIVDGKMLQQAQQKLYFVVNKPKGYVCSSAQQDGLAAKTVISLFDRWLATWAASKPGNAISPRLFTIGRLDVPTTGLLLVTNDGSWAQKVSHPKARTCSSGLAALR